MGLLGRHVGYKTAQIYLCWLLILSNEQGALSSWQDGGNLPKLNEAWAKYITDLARSSSDSQKQKQVEIKVDNGQIGQSKVTGTGSLILDVLTDRDRRGNDARETNSAEEKHGRKNQGGVNWDQIPAKYILLVKLGRNAGPWNRTMKAQLRASLASLLQVPTKNVLLNRAQPESSTIELLFVKPGHESSSPQYSDLYTARHVEDAIAAASLARALPGELHVQHVYAQDGDDDIVMKNVNVHKIYTAPYFPYLMAAVALGAVCLITLLVWCCIRRSRGKSVPNSSRSSPSPTPHVQQQICLYPTAKPDVNINHATLIQPDVTQILTNKSCGECGTPLHGTPLHGTPVSTPPLSIKNRKGLLERRGSNASLTLDLGPTETKPTWGSPPRESSAEEYLLSAGNRMSRKELRNCLKNVKALYEEFWEIPMNHPDKVEVAGSGVKNRYRTIIPNEHSRVKLPEIENDPLSSYINANYIRGYAGEPRAYIATQGPMSNTVIDFWRAVWETKAPIIVMITKLKEKNKSKCESYLPENREIFGEIEVQVESLSEGEGYEVRQLVLKYLNESHTLLHYWYTTWPDHKAPNTARQLLDLVKEVDRQRCDPETGKVRGPVIVHCSAGIGRTGCFIGTSIGMQQLCEEHMVDILGIVCSMRLDRGGMVQTSEQYEFVHQALCLHEKELPDRPPSGE